MNNFIIGIAGHVDHGKTKLTKALTNIDTDSLKEEKERGISIKLGFAYMKLKDGIKIGVIDTPGHEKFIKQMIYGSYGMNLILLTIAADEGIMPQTKEHLEIIKLLEINNLIIVITKIDIVEEKWLIFIKEEIKKYLIDKNYKLKNIPIINVDSISKNGIEKLIFEIEKKRNQIKIKKEFFCVRIYIDRVFILKGFGTIVTGTLLGGDIKKGDYLFLFPNKKKVKIRNIQIYGEKKEKATSGQRVAINISNINIKEIKIGYLLTDKNNIVLTKKIAANILLLENKKISNKEKVYIYIGSMEVLAKIIILKKNNYKNNFNFCILHLENSVVCLKEDRIIICSKNPKRVIGCAIILDIEIKKEKNLNFLFNNLKNKANNNEKEVLLNLIKDNPLNNLEDFSNLMQKSLNLIKNIILKIKKDIYVIENLYIEKNVFQEYKNLIKNYIKEYLEEFPLREGVPKEVIRNKYFNRFSFKKYNILINFFIKEKFLEVNKNYLNIKNNIFNIDNNMKNILLNIKNMFFNDLVNINEICKKNSIEKKIISDYLNYLIKYDFIVKISYEYYIKKEVFLYNKKIITDYINKNENIKLNQAKNILTISKKYVLIFLEYLDLIKITKRIKDKRILIEKE